MAATTSDTAKPLRKRATQKWSFYLWVVIVLDGGGRVAVDPGLALQRRHGRPERRRERTCT